MTRLASGVPMSTPRSSSHARFGYVPALGGLRALAVLSVMLYHGGIVRVSGGFLGVDLLFVLSGYRITTPLLWDWLRPQLVALRRRFGAGPATVR